MKVMSRFCRISFGMSDLQSIACLLHGNIIFFLSLKVWVLCLNAYHAMPVWIWNIFLLVATMHNCYKSTISFYGSSDIHVLDVQGYFAFWKTKSSMCYRYDVIFSKCSKGIIVNYSNFIALNQKTNSNF